MNRLMQDFMKVVPRPVSRKALNFNLNPLISGTIERHDSEMPYTVLYRMKVELGADVAFSDQTTQRLAAEQVCEMVSHYLYKDIYEKLLELRLAVMECEDINVLHKKVSELLDMCR